MDPVSLSLKEVANPNFIREMALAGNIFRLNQIPN